MVIVFADFLPERSLLYLWLGGAFVLGTGFAIMIFNLVYAWFKGPKAPRNPWGSAGFEWQTTTPPHPHNFAEDPVIRRGPYDYHLATDEELATT